MKPRHVAALALVGCYLMVPPPVLHSSLPVDLDAPLSEWRLFSVHDSAAECERGLVAFYKLAKTELVANPADERDRIKFYQLENSQCIDSEQRALSLLDQWRAVRDKLELGMRDSFYYRLRARLFLQSGADDEAEKTFRKAVEAAVVRNARSEVLRSTLPLARLLAKQGRRDEVWGSPREDRSNANRINS